MTNPTLTVLLVEDDELDRERVHRMVGGVWRVVDAGTGQAAADSLARERPDCVLLDFLLPDAEGTGLIPAFVESGVPVVMMTGHGDEQVAVEAMKLGASDYLPKRDLDGDVLRRAVDSAVRTAALTQQVFEQQEELKMFASMASHDLKAPLRSLVGFAQLLALDLEAGKHEKVLEHCQRIRDSGTRMARLIDDLLEYTRTGRSAVVFEPVDLDVVVAEVVARCEALIGECDGRVCVDPLPQVRGDRTGLCQLLQNLVVNGLKYRRDGDYPVVRVSAVQEGDRWCVCVRDNGIGIAADSLEKVFRPFQRLNTRARYDGSGLGLALCKKVADQHGGRIWVESVEGQGSGFFFTLPSNAER